jgi:hypothetical protein
VSRNLGTTYRRQALFVCEGSPASPPSSRQGTLVTSRVEVRSALGPAITRAGGIKPRGHAKMICPEPMHTSQGICTISYCVPGY